MAQRAYKPLPLQLFLVDFAPLFFLEVFPVVEFVVCTSICELWVCIHMSDLPMCFTKRKSTYRLGFWFLNFEYHAILQCHQNRVI